MIFALFTCILGIPEYCQTNTNYPPAQWYPMPPPMPPVCPTQPVCPPAQWYPMPPSMPPACPIPPFCPIPQACPQPVYRPPVCPQPNFPQPLVCPMPPVWPQPVNPCLSIEKICFIETVFRFLELKYWRDIDYNCKCILKPKVGNVLSIIYDSFKKSEERILFVAFAIFTTSGFKVLDSDPQCGCNWRPRGILQICTEGNYRKLAELTGDSSWIRCPDSLASLEYKPTMASIIFWKGLIKNTPGFVLNFMNVLCLLQTKETDPKYVCWAYPSLQNRYFDYVELENMLTVC